MKTKFHAIAVDRIYDVKYDPPARYQVRLESESGETITLTGLRKERVVAFAKVDDGGRLQENGPQSQLVPVETAFFISAEKQSQEDKENDQLSVQTGPNSPAAPATDTALPPGSPS